MNSRSYSKEPRLIIVGDYLFDPRDGLLSGPSGAHHICAQMSALLLALTESPGHVVSRAQLAARAWPDELEPSSLLTQHVGRLRHYLADTARDANYIQTVPSRGYRLVAPVYGSTAEPVAHRPVHIVAKAGGSRLYALIHEFRERKVCRALLVYSIVIWLIFQVSEVVVPALNLPVWVNSLVVILGILGFPIAATLAWIFDLTPSGLAIDGVASGQVQADSGRQRSDLVFDTVLVAAALAICGMLVLSSVSAASADHEEASTAIETQSDSARAELDYEATCLDLLSDGG